MHNLTMARSNKVDLQVQRVAVAPLVGDAFALRDRFDAYDAFYAVVARSSKARLVTCDVDSRVPPTAIAMSCTSGRADHLVIR